MIGHLRRTLTRLTQPAPYGFHDYDLPQDVENEVWEPPIVPAAVDDTPPDRPAAGLTHTELGHVPQLIGERFGPQAG